MKTEPKRIAKKVMTQYELNQAFEAGKSDIYYDGIPDEILAMSPEELDQAIEAELQRLLDLRSERR